MLILEVAQIPCSLRRSVPQSWLLFHNATFAVQSHHFKGLPLSQHLPPSRLNEILKSSSAACLQYKIHLRTVDAGRCLRSHHYFPFQHLPTLSILAK